MVSLLPQSRAFTLVEMLVSLTVLSLMMLFLFSIVALVSSDWKASAAYSNEFQEAQDAFNDMTRHLSEATLNTYSDYNYTSSSTAPPTYVRQSELRFITGPATTLLSGVNSQPHPTHAMFFIAPLGSSSSCSGLPNLLNTCGYYIEYNNNSTSEPAFLASITSAVRSRDRLMEMIVPSESMTIYKYTSGPTPIPTAGPNCLTYSGYTWFTDGFSLTPSPTHILAENVIALIILPRLTSYSVDSTGTTTVAATALAPTYSYDSSPTPTFTAPVLSTDPNAAILNWKNQVPPLVQVTLVAMDEASALRQPAGDVITNLGLTSLFQSAGSLTDPTQAGYAQDMQTLKNALTAKKINYRVFSTTVAIKSANWSTSETN